MLAKKYTIVIVFLVLSLSLLLSACEILFQTATPTIDYSTAGWEIITPRPINTTTATPEPTVEFTDIPTQQPINTDPIPTNTTPLPTNTNTPLPNTPTALACLSEEGEIRHEVFHSNILEKPIDINIYLPPCYDQDAQRHYPVLYLLHGLYANYEQWNRLGVDEMADTLITSGRIEPLLIVMPGETNFYMLDSSSFDEFVMNELIPWVDETFNTIPERQARAIGGLSRGAAWALRMGVENWQTFNAIGTHSLPIVNSEGRRLLNLLKAIPLEDMPALFMDIGDKDPELQYTLEFEKTLTQANIPHVWYLFLGRHEEVYWEKHVEVYLLWYADSIAPDNAP